MRGDGGRRASGSGQDGKPSLESRHTTMIHFGDWQDRVALLRLRELRRLCGRVMDLGNAGEIGVSCLRWEGIQ